MKDKRTEILNYAASHDKFTSADLFRDVDIFLDAKEASDEIRKLYLSGKLEREKIDNLRFAYKLKGFPYDESLITDHGPSKFTNIGLITESVNTQDPREEILSIAEIASDISGKDWEMKILLKAIKTYASRIQNGVDVERSMNMLLYCSRQLRDVILRNM